MRSTNRSCCKPMVPTARRLGCNRFKINHLWTADCLIRPATGWIWRAPIDVDTPGDTMPRDDADSSERPQGSRTDDAGRWEARPTVRVHRGSASGAQSMSHKVRRKRRNPSTDRRTARTRTGPGVLDGPAAAPKPWNSARPAKVAKGRRLIQDPAYPPARVLDAIADLFSRKWRRGDDASSGV